MESDTTGSVSLALAKGFRASLSAFPLTCVLEALEQGVSLSSQRAEVGLAAHVVVQRGADVQVIQEQPERRVQRRVPQVLAVLVQPGLDEDQQGAGGGSRGNVTAGSKPERLRHSSGSVSTYLL